MKKKHLNFLFYGSITLALTALFGSLSLTAIDSNSSITNRGPSGQNLHPEFNQNKIVHKISSNDGPSSSDLSIEPQGADWVVTGLTEQGRRQSSISVPEGVTKIANRAFKDDMSLVSIKFPTSLTTIGDEVFSNCLHLTKVDLNEGLQSIGTNAFNTCVLLTELLIPRSVKNIANDAFYMCTAITKFNLPPGITTIHRESFWINSVSSIWIPASVQNYDGASFRQSSFSLSPDKKYDIIFTDENAVKAFVGSQKRVRERIFSCIFEDYISAFHVWTPNSTASDMIKSLGSEYFKPENIDTLTSLGNKGIYVRPDRSTEMVGLNEQGKASDEVTIPTSVTTIPDFVFSDCSSKLKKICFEGSSISLNDHSFYGVPNDTDYYVSYRDLERSLSDKGISDAHIVRVENNYDYDLSGVIRGVKSKAISDNTFTIPEKILDKTVSGIGPHAFKDCGTVNKIIFPSAITTAKIDPHAFDDLNQDKTYYYVDENNTDLIGQLVGANVNKDHIVFSDSDQKFDVTSSGLIYHFYSGAIKEGNVSVPLNDSRGNPINGICSNAFAECTGATKVTFLAGSKAFKIDPHAFDGLNPEQTYYYVDGNDVNIIQSLKGAVNVPEHIIVQGSNFKITGGGTILQINSSDLNLIVNKSYANFDVKGIGSNAFRGCQNVKTIEFADGINFTGTIAPDAFGGLNQPIVYVYGHYNATVLARVANDCEIGVDSNGGDLFFSFSESMKFDGLTLRGRSQNQLTLPDNINSIGSNAFNGCSSSLNKITIRSSQINIDPGVFTVTSLRDIIDNIQFNVLNDDVKGALMSAGIKEDKINVSFSPIPSPSPSPTPSPSSSGHAANSHLLESAGIAICAIGLAIVIIGFGIAFPMMKQNKINLITSQLNRSRIRNTKQLPNATPFGGILNGAVATSKKNEKAVIGVHHFNVATPFRKTTQTVPIRYQALRSASPRLLQSSVRTNNQTAQNPVRTQRPFRIPRPFSSPYRHGTTNR